MTQEAQHTPGPFDATPKINRPVDTGKKARNGAPIYYNPAIKEDCVFYGGQLYAPSVWEKMCDDFVKDAAPELLEALEKITKEMDGDSDGTCETFWEEVQEAREAIAKAKGQS